MGRGGEGHGVGEERGGGGGRYYTRWMPWKLRQDTQAMLRTVAFNVNSRDGGKGGGGTPD